jgi:hypothetical protein
MAASLGIDFAIPCIHNGFLSGPARKSMSVFPSSADKDQVTAAARRAFQRANRPA